MVRTLIAMRAASLRNARHSRFGILSLIGTALIGLLAAGSTLLLGFTVTGSASGRADQLALALLTWGAGRIGFAAFSGGDPAIALDLFRLIPVRRRALARSLLILGFADPALAFLAVAFASIAALGFRYGPVAGTVGIAGAIASLALVSILSTIVAAVVPSGSRRRQDLGTLLAAIIISAVVVMGTLIQPLLSLLSSGRAPILSAVLRLLPTGWATDAVAAAALGQVTLVALPFAGFFAVGAALVLWWPHLLGSRLVSQATSGRRAGTRNRGRVLPATPMWAVASRELRLWIRDPNRAGFLLIALVVGLGICLVPVISESTALLLPFAGIGTAVIAAAVAGNVYGFDGAAIAVILMAAGAERADVRGRQAAWLLLIGPYTILLSVAGILVSDQASVAPWVFGLLPAVLGGAAGVIPVVSLLAPQPLDDSGSPGPAWVVKAYATIILTALTAAPAVALLIIGAVTRASIVSWLAIPVGVASGILCAAILGHIAGSRLIRRGPEVFEVFATAGRRE